MKKRALYRTRKLHGADNTFFAGGAEVGITYTSAISTNPIFQTTVIVECFAVGLVGKQFIVDSSRW
jgi:hypothetical protein